MNRKIHILLALAVALLLTAAVTRAADPYTPKEPMHIGGEGRWDYVSVDSVAHRLYLTRTTHTQAIDLTSGKVVLDVPGQKRSHGVVAVNKVGRGYITDGGAGVIIAFDLKSGNVLGNIAAADDADGEIYDPGTDRILVTCGDAGTLAILDASADPKTAKVDIVELGGKPEFLAADGKGMAYANLQDKNQVAVIDLKAMKVTARWSLGGGTSPAGLAIDPVHGRLFVGCHNKKMIVLDTTAGKVLADLPIGSGNDACAFDAGTGYAFASCGDMSLTVVKETAPGKFEIVQTVKTPSGARTMAVDASSHVLYLPTAEFNPLQPGDRRPSPKPGTFMIAVVAPPAP